MSSFIRMQPVVETPGDEDEFFCPWEVSAFEPYSIIRLHGEMKYPEIGLVIAQLAHYNRIELVENKHLVIKQIIKAKSLVLPGGIEVVAEGKKTISPGCCCGLETWGQWIHFLKTGYSPWLGHDPYPWVEMQDNVVRIWSDGGVDPVSDAFYIDVSRSEFEKNLTRVERDLKAFLFCIESWAQEIGVVEPSKLVQKFDQCFRITRS